MHLQEIQVDNFLRISRLRLNLSKPRVQMICGHNEAGKTTLQEAIRFCLLGETQRVNRKGDYKLMVKDGAKDGKVTMKVDDAVLARDVQTARGSAEEYAKIPDALEYLLDATRYTWLDPRARRRFMFNLMQITISADDVRHRLIEDHGVDERMVEVIMPMLKAGFDSAHQLCRDKATECRGEWQAITGERYGSQKAQGWKPEIQEDVDVATRADAVGKLMTAKEQLDKTNREIGKREAYTTMALGDIFSCPSCGARICIDNQHENPIRVVKPEEEKRTPSEDQAELSGMKKADEDELAAAQHNVAAAEQRLKEVDRQMEINRDAEIISNRAAEAARQVTRWVAASEALAPTGIPASLIAEKIKPLNDRLRQTALTTGWPQVSITSDMQILVDNRLYQLQSESSQWRAQAAIAEAISFISRIGVLVLDRLDVLDIKNRVALIKWVLTMREDHNNILLFGTFKEPPRVPEQIAVHWLVDGQLAQQNSPEAA